ncbi:MAG: periplasmic heavy metal sensor [Thermodesulfobacteriota bacterium]
MKRIMIITALFTGISLAGLSTATAYQGWMGKGPGPNGPGNWQGCGNNVISKLSEEDRQKVNTFLLDTKEMRKMMVMKRAEKMALMRTDNPDPAKASQLAGEMFDLRNGLREKARAAGVEGMVGPNRFMQNGSPEGPCGPGTRGFGMGGRRMGRM